MHRVAKLSRRLAARPPYWALVLLLEHLHAALGRPAPPSEEEDAPAANADAGGGAVAQMKATAPASSAKNGTGDASSTATATAAWATQTSGGMQQSSDKQDTIVLHSDASIS